VQYVPHAFGFKAMNVGLAQWLFQARWRERIWVMFHEVCYPRRWGQPLKHNFLGTVQRWMAGRVARAARRRFVSTPQWSALLDSLGTARGPTEWLPVPSTVATQADACSVDEIRNRFAEPDGQILGHFGTFSDNITPLLTPCLTAALRQDRRRVAILIGRYSHAYGSRLGREHPDLATRIKVTGELDAQALANHLAACDLMVQPFPDGVTARRTSVMASAALGLPIVASRGPFTESIWDEYRAVCLTENTTDAWVGAIEGLLADVQTREVLRTNIRRLYRDWFAVERTVAVLQARHQEDLELENGR
jgi:hypothetical protein